MVYVVAVYNAHEDTNKIYRVGGDDEAAAIRYAFISTAVDEKEKKEFAAIMKEQKTATVEELLDTMRDLELVMSRPVEL